MTIRPALAALAAAALVATTASAVTLHRGNGFEADTLDPHKYQLTAERFILTDLFEGLVAVNAKAEPIPGIAESWDISPDGRVYTFHLRAGLKWSDGAPLTADDEVAGLRRVFDPKTAAPLIDDGFIVKNGRAVAAGQMPVDQLGVRAVDERTVEVTLESPSSAFIQRIANWPYFAPLPRHLYASAGDGWTKAGVMVSNGAYMLAERVPNERVRLVKNPNYWDAANVAIDEIVYSPAEDEASALKQFRAGELDLHLAFPLSEYPWLQQNMAAETRLDPSVQLTYLAFNQTKPPFNDARVRKALSLALDRTTLTTKVVNVGLTPAYSLVPAVVPGWSPDPANDTSTTPFAERQAEARALLAEAGYDEGNPLSVRFDYRAGDINKRMAVAMGAMWKAVGVTAQLQANEVKSHYVRLRQGDFEVADGGWTGGPAAEFFATLLTTGSQINWGKWSNAEYDRLVAEGGAEMDGAKSLALFRQADAIALADTGIAPLYFASYRSLVHVWVKGFEGNLMNAHPSRFMRVER